MQYCVHCGKQIDDDSSFCPNCGKPTNDEPIVDSRQIISEPVSDTKSAKKKDSILSIVAAVFALLGWIAYGIFAFIGLIISIVDLALAPKEQPKCRHLGSYFAIVIAIIVIILSYSHILR